MGDIKVIEIIIAIVLVIISFFQFRVALYQSRTNERARQQDLYDKRWDYYIRAKKDFLDDWKKWTENSHKDDFEKHIENYVSSYADEAFFLFGEDIEGHVRNTMPKILEKTGERTIKDPVTSFRQPFEKYLRIK